MMSPCPVFLVIFPERRKTHTSQCSKNQKKVPSAISKLGSLCFAKKTKLK